MESYNYYIQNILFFAKAKVKKNILMIQAGIKISIIKIHNKKKVAALCY